MTTQVLVLGDGTGGLVAANLLAKEARRRSVPLRTVLIGSSPVHTYQPGMLFLPFRAAGYRTLADIQRRWKRGDALSGAALGLPSADSSYELCFYDSTDGVPEIVGQVSVPSQSGCRATMERAVYRDRSARFSGVRKLKLKTGTAGKSAIALVGLGDALAIPDPISATAYFAMAPDVTVQLSSSSGVCATSVFDLARRNDPTDFRAVARDGRRSR